MARKDQPDNVPPHDLEAERATLGAVLVNSAVLADVRSIVRPGDFFDDRHRNVFQAMCQLDDENVPADLVAVGNRYKVIAGDFNWSLLAELSGVVPTSGHAKHYANIVRENAELRRIAEAARFAYVRAYRRESSRDIGADLQLAIDDAVGFNRRRGIRGMNAVFEDYVDYFNQTVAGATPPGLKTGFATLDRWLGTGIENDMTVVIGARSSDGKSTFLQNLIVNIGFAHGPGLLFSIEESTRRILRRIHKILAPHNDYARAHELRDTNSRDLILKNALDRLRRLPLFIDDSTRYIEDMRTFARAHFARHPETTFVAFDYFQLIRSRNDRLNGRERYDYVLDVIREIKDETGKPVIILSQFRKEGFEPGRGPHLALLKETGRLENDADIILLLWDKSRDEERLKSETENKYRQPSTYSRKPKPEWPAHQPEPAHRPQAKEPDHPVVELNVRIAKIRDGRPVAVNLRWFKPQFRISSFEKDEANDFKPTQTQIDLLSASDPATPTNVLHFREPGDDAEDQPETDPPTTDEPPF